MQTGAVGMEVNDSSKKLFFFYNMYPYYDMYPFYGNSFSMITSINRGIPYILQTAKILIMGIPP